MKVPLFRLVAHTLRSLIVLGLAGLAGAALVRLAPGWDVDETQLDVRLSRRSVAQIGQERAQSHNPVSFYAKYLAGLARGEVGRSELYGQAVAQLIRERYGSSARNVVDGLAGAWCAALILGMAVALRDGSVTRVGAAVLTASALSIPAAVLAVFCLLARFPPSFAIATIVFPRIFPHVYEQLRFARAKPHVLFGRARGVSQVRVLLWYMLPMAAGPLIALGGVSVTLALSASIPVEALAGSPGIGHLAWEAALGRDLPVLVTITLLLTAITTLVNLCSTFILFWFEDRAG
jgi:peptide/nickel transport system permease protein